MDDRKIGYRETLMTMFKHLALKHSTISTKLIKKLCKDSTNTIGVIIKESSHL
jgi:hypothetical protein